MTGGDVYSNHYETYGVMDINLDQAVLLSGITRGFFFLQGLIKNLEHGSGWKYTS